jgi:catechol 2,3-dioxygenase-like lactoylglutathione lyase family enzyme
MRDRATPRRSELRTLAITALGQPPHLRYGVFAVGPDTALLVFEVPGYDPVADGIGVEMGRRGRIDHFALRVDEAAFFAVVDRLVAAGASNGAVTAFGPYHSVSFRDPDGLEGNIICPNQAFDPTQVDDELTDCSNPPVDREPPVRGSRNMGSLMRRTMTRFANP